MLTPSADNCKRHDFEVEKKGPVTDVIEIVAKPLFQARKSAPAVDLGVPGNATSDAVTRVVRRVFLFKFAGKFRAFGPRSYKAHVAAQHIPELGQLVESGPTEKPADSSATRIMGYGPDRTELRFRALAHRSEFNNPEVASAEAHSNLTIKHGTTIIQFDDSSNHKEHGRQYNERK
jgi:hypothetical protein